jgi:FtsP/CotA-like multicopper oxidase with cupredoxin domain
VTRTFRFDRSNGQWTINNRFFDCNERAIQDSQNTGEHWVLQNNSGDGSIHPVHFEEFQIISRNGRPPSAAERSRKDVVGCNSTRRS